MINRLVWFWNIEVGKKEVDLFLSHGFENLVFISLGFFMEKLLHRVTIFDGDAFGLSGFYLLLQLLVELCF